MEAGMYRGAQPSPKQIAALRRDFHIRTIIRLNRGNAAADRSAARAAGIRLIEIPIDPKKLGTADRATRDSVERAYQAFADPKNAPVFIHCDHGRERTGYVVALFRARNQHWPYPRIFQELSQFGHGPLMRWYLPDITRQLARDTGYSAR